MVAKDHEESYEQLASGKVDAFAGDDVLLYGFIAEHKAENDLEVIGDFLSYDPYGIMYRKDDPELADLVNRVFREMAESRDLEYTYDRWFLKKLPSGETLNLPMSAQLGRNFQGTRRSGVNAQHAQEKSGRSFRLQICEIGVISPTRKISELWLIFAGLGLK